MIKKLKGILGLGVGPSVYTPHPSVIGEVERSLAGNTTLRIGRATVTDKDHPSWTQTEYVALTPEERDKLIDILTSQQPYRTIRIGDVVGSGETVLAVQYVNGQPGNGDLAIGTVLSWNDHKREYVVYTADPFGNVSNGLRREDSQRAHNAYMARATDHFFRHFNTSPPALTYAHVAERDRLTVTS